jgi:hypothetical protein
MDFPMRLSVLWAALVCVALGGCGNVPVTSLIKLARVNLETSDPAQVRAAVLLPQVLRPRSVVLRISVRVGNAAEQTRDFALRELPVPPELAREAGGNTHIHAYRMEDADLARLTAFRSELIARKRAGQGGNVSIAVEPHACKTADLPDGPLYFTAYLRTVETVDYVVLARDVDLRSVMPERTIPEDIPRCDS